MQGTRDPTMSFDIVGRLVLNLGYIPKEERSWQRGWVYQVRLSKIQVPNLGREEWVVREALVSYLR